LYTLEGTRMARWYLASIVVLYVMHGAIEVVLTYHACHPPPGVASACQSEIVSVSWWTRVSSLFAIVIDFVVIIVVYQALYNVTKRRLPIGIGLYIALVVAMAVDAALFTALNNNFFEVIRYNGLNIKQKLEAGFFSGAPVAAYLTFVTKGEPVLDRGALELLNLRNALKEAETKLKESRAQFLYIKETFSRYVSPAVVDAIVQDPSRVRLGGDMKDVTVLFADIRGYSTLSEQLSPTEVIGLLNRYFEKVSSVILNCDGMINEFEGDGILAVFGAPLELKDHADRAVEAALKMLDAVDELNVEWENDGTAKKWQSVGLDKLRIRVGIHSGPVVAGNVGSAARIKYAVIGDTVNTAARVEALNKELKTTILCTAGTVERLARMKDRVSRDLGSHQVKGKAEPVHVYGFDKSS
jgi:class 3 adenylate cyclase